MDWEMDENSEPEEGEACYHQDDGDDFNPDTAFSYIDEKIKNVLGHFQKDFEGGVSAENLGAKFGGYGSFLPTYERSPSRLSRPKTPQRNISTPRSPNNISMEGAAQSLKAPPYATKTRRPRNACLPTANVAAKHDSHFPAAQVVEKSALKAESFNRAVIPTEQKTLKVRIKMVSDNKAQKNAAIYSGLGLDDSPSSSLGNSPEESGGTVSISQETTSKSPSRILEVMTASHVPGGKLISPLHDSLLCLLRKQKERDSISIPSLKACQEYSAGFKNESNSGNGKQLNGKKTKILMGQNGKMAEPKHGSGMDVENDKTLLIKRKSENVISGGKELLSSNLNHTALSNSVNIADSMEATARAFDVSAEANLDGSRGRLFSSDSAKEDSLESISGRSRSSSKNKKRNKQSNSMQKGWEQSIVNCHKSASHNLGNNVGRNVHQNSASKEDPKMKVGQLAKFHVKDKRNIPSEKEKVEGKKSKASKNRKQNADSVKESVRLDVGATSKDTTSSSQALSTGKIKMYKFKKQKDASRVRDNHRDGLEGNFEQKTERMEPSLMRPSHHRSKDSGRTDFEMEQSASLDKSKDISSGRPVDNRLSGVDASCVAPHLADKMLAPQTLAPVAPASVLIQENWVQCDRCTKWRLLPFYTTPEQLPEKWLCSMLNWLPGMNRCDISEEETTKALNALYQLPVAENEKNPQNHASGTTLLVTSSHLQNLDQTNSSFNSQVPSLPKKKKNGLKKVHKAGSSVVSQISNSNKSQQQESLKSRSLTDMTQVAVENNLIKEYNFQLKEKHPVGGEAKLAKMKTKRESGPYAYEGSKKTRTDCMCTTDNNRSSDLDPNPGRRGLNSGTGLLIQANGRSVQNENECSNSGDIKHNVKETVKKHVGHTQASSDVGSLDMRVCDKRDTSMKKRKLEDRQDSQNIKEESSESGFQNGKKSRVLKIEGKHSRRNDGDGTLNRKSMDHLIDGIEEVRSIDQNQQATKHKKKSASQNPLDGLESLRRDSGTGQISVAATSSSSKVSGSRKTGANFEEARASPVESVSSSPIRSSYPEKLASTGGDASGNNDCTNGGIPVGDLRRCWSGEGTGEFTHTVKAMKVKVSSDVNRRLLKSSPLDSRDRDSVCKISIKTKPSSRLGSRLLNGHTDSAQNGQHNIEQSHGEDRVKKESHVNAFSSQRSDKGSSVQTKDSERTPAADKKKVYDSKTEQDLCSRKNRKHLSDVDSKGHQGAIANSKHNLPDKSSAKSSKDERNYAGGRDPSGQSSSDSRLECRSNIKNDGFDAISATPCITRGDFAPEHNQDLGGQSKVMQVESRSGMSKLPLHCEVESQQERKGHQTILEAQGVVSDGFAVNGSRNSDISKALKQPGKAGSKNGLNHSLGPNMPDMRGVRDLNAPSPVGNSPSQTATNALKDAKELRNYADRLKSSGFAFESNEIYFQAALKFLGVAALLETSISENGRHVEMNQMQVYSTATKLCEMCAQEYEKRREMASAALAYKCMEVAYMRVVYCKHSTSSRDRNELQATLQMVPQGDSPSSSASDVDNNLNNQPAVDKAPLVKGNGSLVAGTHVIVARNRPSFVRLLDFTQDVSFAMEASRKSQNAFAAANLKLEEAQNTECIISVKKVIDFSFQDVDGLVQLAQQAVKAITRSGLGSARD